jgi:hypothetical protein
MTTIVNVKPDETCIVMPMDRTHESKEGMTATGFNVMIGKKVRRHETAAFELPGTGLKVKFVIRKASNFHSLGLPVKQSVFSDMFITQIILVEPDDDIFQIEVNETNKGFLTSDSDSYTLIQPQAEHEFRLLRADDLDYFYYTIDIFGKIWKPEFANTSPGSTCTDVVDLKVGEYVIKTSKSLLTKNSVMFERIFEEDDAEEVEVSDFSIEVVREMVRFMMHGYCSGWTKRGDELAIIGDLYKVKGMIEFAAEKKKLLQAMEAGTAVSEGEEVKPDVSSTRATGQLTSWEPNQ